MIRLKIEIIDLRNAIHVIDNGDYDEYHAYWRGKKVDIEVWYNKAKLRLTKLRLRLKALELNNGIINCKGK